MTQLPLLDVGRASLAQRRNDLVRTSSLFRKLSSAYHFYRSNRWRGHDVVGARAESVVIDRPVFLLGTEGGGLTLVSRILRRIEGVVSCSGDHRYWAGDDEMCNVMSSALPAGLRWPRVDVPGMPASEHSWLYANDLLLPHYRQRAEDATPEVAAEYQRLIRLLIAVNGDSAVGASTRFIDKSQPWSVKVELIDALLRGHAPKFVLLVRNPVAMCWRAAARSTTLSTLPLSDAERLDLAIQHWKNSTTIPLAVQGSVDVRAWRFEDVLRQPEREMRAICDFTELPFSPRILPRADDVVPWGSCFDAFNRHKWYPLRADVNDPYLREVPDWARDRIRSLCADLVERFDY